MMGIDLPDGSHVNANLWDWMVSEAKGFVSSANSE